MAHPIYVINLGRENRRLANIGGQLDRLGLGWQRVAAIDRQEVDATAVRAEFGTGKLGRMFPSTLGDMCCSLSHRRAWQILLASGSDIAVILEDDAILSDSFANLMRADLPALLRHYMMGVLKIEFWPGPQKNRRFPAGEFLGPFSGASGPRIYRLRSSFMGTCGYVITAEAVRTLIGRFPNMAVPVDHYLFGATAQMGFDLLQVGFMSPAPVLHGVAEFGSDIGSEREAVGLTGHPATLCRRFVEFRHSRRLARDIRRGVAERVEMRFAGGPLQVQGP